MFLQTLNIGGGTFRVSTVFRALDEHQWDGYIFPNIDPPQSGCEYPSGGFAGALTWGRFTYSLELFTRSVFPPPDFIPCSNALLADNVTDEFYAVHLIDGTLHNPELDNAQVSYSIYIADFDQEMLETATNYDGEDEEIQRLFGYHEYASLTRLENVEGNPVYHLRGLEGTIGVDISFFDDGVDIDTNVTINGDGTITLSEEPIGDITATGTATYGTANDDTLSSISEWAAQQLGIAHFDASLAADPIPVVSSECSSQENIVKYVSKMCAFFCHILNYDPESDTLYLIDMAADNGERTLTSFDFFKNGSYKKQNTVKKITTTQIIRTLIDDAAGIRINETEKNIDVTTNDNAGDPEDIESFIMFSKNGSVKSLNKARLTAIAAIRNKRRMTIKIPISAERPKIGEKIMVIDDSMPIVMTAMFHVRNITYDFSTYMYIIEGEGELSV